MKVRLRLKGLHASKSARKGDAPIYYFYAWRGGPRCNYPDGTPITDKTDPALATAYAKAHEDLKKRPVGTIDSLIDAFLIANEFTKLSDSSKRDYRRHLDRIRKKFGTLPMGALEAPQIRGLMKDWRDEIAAASGDRTADYIWTVMARVFSVAKDRGKIKTNPCERGGRLYDGDRSDRVWSEADEAKWYAKAQAHMHLPVMLGLWTGQREADILKLTWLQYDGHYIRLEQQKGRKGKKKRVVIPCGEPLRMALDALKANIMSENGGKPPDGIICRTMRAHNGQYKFTEDGFRTSFAKNCKRAGITDLTFHDTRGTAVTRLSIAGATLQEIVPITGHSLKTAQEIIDKHYLNHDVKLAESAIMKLEVSKGIVRVAAFKVVAGGKA
jgi:integrase